MTNVWESESNSKDFVHGGLPCAMRRVDWGVHWCGYVGVPQGHPLYGIDDVSRESGELRVHSGITYTGSEWPIEDKAGTWWFGFDCAHACDLVPKQTSIFGSHGVYRTEAYVEEQCRQLAEQLLARSGVAVLEA